MFARVVTVLVLIPLAVILIALTVANRETVAFTLDPFEPGNLALTFEAPMFVFLYAAVLIGVLIGGAATWFTQGKHRKRARKLSRQAKSRLTAGEEAQSGRTSSGIALPAPGS